MSANNASNTVLVIGAGPAGIAAAYYLKRAGLAYQVVDKGAVIAETWARLYPSLRLNTTRYFSHMPGKRFPWHYGVFPTGRQYYRYLVDYVRQQGLNIQLNTEVTRLTPENGGYRVEMRTPEGTVSGWYANVILAPGRYNKPYIAPLPALEAYTGNVIHSQAYTGTGEFDGQRVMVVGNGPSGMDISIDIGRRNAPSAPVILAMRTGIVLRRRYPLGLSKHAWMIVARYLPGWLARPLLNYVENMGYRPSALRGIKQPRPGQVTSSAATRGPELIHAVRAGWVICTGAPLEADGRRIRVEHLDGVRRWHEIDTVIMATGYRASLDFLDGIDYTTDENDWPLRYNSQPYSYPRRLTYDVGEETDERLALHKREIAGYPGLFLQGVFYKGKGTTYNINVEAEVIVEQIRQRLAARRDERKGDAQASPVVS